ncbi:MAG: hypothetical protein P8X74_07345 [Reinekea sp.]
MLVKNFNEPMGAPAIFDKQIEIKLFHSGVMDSGESNEENRVKSTLIKSLLLLRGRQK